eukprot:TRINITY_DN16727_c0_g1_i1.p1 TRINITY_DN16727_c0_g1~~TRINITY_DN16727_c0_g1_i1.p1  ORF type:complete len:1129 (+),score=259.24 TRINITY_DN16727_c0_g1_i1:432-3389(+)
MPPPEDQYQRLQRIRLAEEWAGQLPTEGAARRAALALGSAATPKAVARHLRNMRGMGISDAMRYRQQRTAGRHISLGGFAPDPAAEAAVAYSEVQEDYAAPAAGAALPLSPPQHLPRFFLPFYGGDLSAPAAAASPTLGSALGAPGAAPALRRWEPPAGLAPDSAPLAPPLGLAARALLQLTEDAAAAPQLTHEFRALFFRPASPSSHMDLAPDHSDPLRRAEGEQAAPSAVVWPPLLPPNLAPEALLLPPAIVTTTLPPNICGDGMLGVQLGGAVEECDDGGNADGDGCSSVCTTEPGYACVPSTLVRRGKRVFIGEWGGQSVCVQNDCGDADRHPTEECDDGALAPGDGCDGKCLIEPDYLCTGSVGTRSFCEPPVCGDAREATVEQCDDGNLIPGDGCDATCRLETFLAFKCENQCTSECDRYENQKRTICLPFAPEAGPQEPPMEFTSTMTPLLNLTPPTHTPTLTLADDVEASLVWNATVMQNIGTPCGALLNGRKGCCNHLGELPTWDGHHRRHPYGLLSLAVCRWPRVGWVEVSSGTCESWGLHTVNDSWPLMSLSKGAHQCLDGAMALRLDYERGVEEVRSEPPPDSTEVEVRGLTVHAGCFARPPLQCWDPTTQVGRLDGLYRRKNWGLYEYVGPFNMTGVIFWWRGRWNLHHRVIADDDNIDRPWFSSARLEGAWTNDSDGDEFTRRYPILPYPRVHAAGRPLPQGCSYATHTDGAQRSRLRYFSGRVAAASAPRANLLRQEPQCSKEVRCLCRIDPLNTKGVAQPWPSDPRPGPFRGDHGAARDPEYWDPRITLRCSYLLHQLYCGYPCLAPYDKSSETECRVVATCPVGTVSCDIPQHLTETRDRAAEAMVKGWGAHAGDNAELRAALDRAEHLRIGSCRGTGQRLPVCEDWLRDVYKECRFQPVAYFNWTHQLDPPLPACQPMWWRYRNYEDFVALQPWLRVAKTGCWSGAPRPGGGAALLVAAAFAAALWL